MNLASGQLILISAQRANPAKASEWRHLGSAFHVGPDGLIVTCAHVINKISQNEMVVALPADNMNQLCVLEDVRLHPRFDFAVATIVRNDKWRYPFLDGGQQLHIADEVRVFSNVIDGRNDEGHPIFAGRLFQGYVSHVNSNDENQIYRTRNEVSFPVLNGFSGAPLFGNYPVVPVQKESWRIVGMCHGNIETSIQVYAFEEREGDGPLVKETVHRIVEFGLVHSAYDIRIFLKDLGVDEPTLATQGDSRIDPLP